MSRRPPTRRSGTVAVGMLRAIRATSRTRMADFAGGFMRRLGPRLKEHGIGRANLAAAFPGQIRSRDRGTSCRRCGTTSGRVAAEFAHIDRLQMFEPDPHDQGDMLYTQEVYERFKRLRDDGKPALIFAAHLANWELPALVASKYRLNTTVLYRRPNIGAVSDAIIQIRKDSMGTLVPTGLDAPLKLLRVLEAGGHVAMLVDQYYVNARRRDLLRPYAARPTPSSPGSRATSTAPFTARGSCACPTSAAFASTSPRRSSRGATPTARSTSPAPCRLITSVVEGWVREHRSNGSGCIGAGAEHRSSPSFGSHAISAREKSEPAAVTACSWSRLPG